MLSSLYSPYWHRIARLRPALRGHVQVHRHFYRNQPWFLIQDHSSGKFHRFSDDAYAVVALFDGHRTLDDIWSILVRRFDDTVMRQDEIVQLLAKLYRADALVVDGAPDTGELFDRMIKTRNRMRLMRWRSPLSIRIPLFDPQDFLDRTRSIVRPLLSPFGALLWLLTVVSAVVLAALNWSELTGNVIDRVLSAESLLILAVTFPIVKLLHEFGHAYITRLMGGEVHEIGVIVLVLMPVPYCEASSATAFSEPWKRALVGAGGMLVELFVASLAMWVWVNAEPGMVRAVAFNVMLIAGVSTLLFNGNPLIRFDGYYILSDLIEIPNLATRSNQYFAYLFQRYLFGMKQTLSPANSTGESLWMFFYAIGSFCYRIFLTIVIVLFLAGQFFIIGVILAIWAFVLMALQPLWKQLMFLVRSPRLNGHRFRAIGVSSALLAGLLVLLSQPMPLATLVEGVVWVPEQARQRVQTEGFVEEVQVANGAQVTAGEVLLVIRNRELETRARVLRAQLTELTAQMESFNRTDQVQLELTREQVDTVRARLAGLEAELDGLVLRSSRNGRFVFQDERDLEGKFLQRGTLVGFVSDERDVTARVVVPQESVDLVRQDTRAVHVRMVHDPATRIEADIQREVPGGSQVVPSLVLAVEGGGSIPLDPRVTTEPVTFGTLFQFDVVFPLETGKVRYGERVHVRFDHGEEPLYAQLYRQIRQVFLKRFEV